MRLITKAAPILMFLFLIASLMLVSYIESNV